MFDPKITNTPKAVKNQKIAGFKKLTKKRISKNSIRQSNYQPSYCWTTSRGNKFILLGVSFPSSKIKTKSREWLLYCISRKQRYTDKIISRNTPQTSNSKPLFRCPSSVDRFKEMPMIQNRIFLETNQRKSISCSLILRQSHSRFRSN